MIKGVRYFVSHARESRFLKQCNVGSQDVFIASFPKSGNTWLRFILARALYDEKTINTVNIDERFPSVHQNDVVKMKSLASPRYIKTHHAYFDLYPKTVYIYRDYRAVAVSAWFHAKNKSSFKGSLEEFIESDLLVSFGPWYWHLETAFAWKEKHPERILILRYEDVLHDTHKAITGLLNFIKLDPIVSIEEIVRKTSFAALQRLEKVTQPVNEQPFFRSGETDDWKKYMTPALEQMLLDKNNKAMLQRCGYLK